LKYEKLEVGKTYYNVERRQMGNVKGLSSVCVFHVKIVSLNPERRSAMVSWNGNRETPWGERQLSKLRTERPVVIYGPMGRGRLQTREEKKAAKEAKSVQPDRT